MIFRQKAKAQAEAAATGRKPAAEEAKKKVLHSVETFIRMHYFESKWLKSTDDYIKRKIVQQLEIESLTMPRKFLLDLTRCGFIGRRLKVAESGKPEVWGSLVRCLPYFSGSNSFAVNYEAAACVRSYRQVKHAHSKSEFVERDIVP